MPLKRASSHPSGLKFLKVSYVQTKSTNIYFKWLLAVWFMFTEKKFPHSLKHNIDTIMQVCPHHQPPQWSISKLTARLKVWGRFWILSSDSTYKISKKNSYTSGTKSFFLSLVSPPPPSAYSVVFVLTHPLFTEFPQTPPQSCLYMILWRYEQRQKKYQTQHSKGKITAQRTSHSVLSSTAWKQHFYNQCSLFTNLRNNY